MVDGSVVDGNRNGTKHDMVEIKMFYLYVTKIFSMPCGNILPK
jgi:hypothetical protein